MAKTAILIDSTTVIPSGLIENERITVIPIPIQAGDREYRDGVDLSSRAFLDLLESSRHRPTTAVPGIGEFASYYGRLLADHNAIVYPIASRKLSGLFNAAVQAAIHVGVDVVAIDPPEDRSGGVHIVHTAGPSWPSDLDRLGAVTGPLVAVVNSGLVSGGTGLMVLDAMGGSAPDKAWNVLVRDMVRAKSSAGLLFVLNTLDYVVDRVGALRAFVGTLLRIKPVLELRDGLVVDVARARTEGQALSLIVDLVERRVGDRPIRAYFLHADAEDSAHTLASMAASRLTIRHQYFGDCGATVARYTGRGGVGMAYCAVADRL